MDLTVDFAADAGYLRYNGQAVARTIPWHGMNLDLAADGKAVGVEFLTLKDLTIVVGDVTFGPFSEDSAPVTVTAQAPAY